MVRTTGRDGPPHQGGFSLIELMLAVVLGAVLVVALSEAAGLFGSQVEYVTADLDTEMEETLSEVTSHVRHAWLVEQSNASSLDVTDALGGETAFFLESEALKVKRPNGSVGNLIEGVKDVTFDLSTVTRLREDTALDVYGESWSRAVTGTAQALTVPVGGTAEAPVYESSHVAGVTRDGEEIALGFTISAGAPSSVNTVDGVTEELLATSLDRLVLPVAIIPAMPSIPAVTDTPLDPEDEGKVTICHIPPGNPDGAHTIIVGESAVSGHLAHGDTLGECGTSDESSKSSKSTKSSKSSKSNSGDPDPDASGQLVIEIYESRGTDDGRPYGSLMGSMSFPVSALPTASYSWQTASGALLEPGSVTTEAITGLRVNPPDVDLPIDLATMALTILPGVPYTVVMRYTGTGLMSFRAAGATSANFSGVASKPASSSDFTPRAMEIDLTIDGIRTYTQTADYEVVVRVTTTVEMLDGRTLASSSIIASQSVATDPWHGQVPGELPELDLKGQ